MLYFRGLLYRSVSGEREEREIKREREREIEREIEG
jgi:hypothetical protein